MTTYDLRATSHVALAFGPFRFLPMQRALLRADQRLRLGSRAREILVLLVERAGEVVTKRELLARVWPDSVVEEGTLRVHIAAIRRTLGADAYGLSYVENITGRGISICCACPASARPARATVGVEQRWSGFSRVERSPDAASASGDTVNPSRISGMSGSDSRRHILHHHES
ncbi:MAG: transcriptional regulator [Gammaproteobacteria bacterium]